MGATACTTSSDAECDSCNEGVTYSDADDDSACQTCSTCAVGYGATSTCTSNAVTECEACVDQTSYSDVDDQSSCATCSECDAGMEVSTDCTVSADTTCAAVACPSDSVGDDLVSGCTCEHGISGYINPIQGSPYYDFVGQACLTTATSTSSSTECESAGLTGDISGDGVVNVLDVVRLVGIIMEDYQ